MKKVLLLSYELCYKLFLICCICIAIFWECVIFFLFASICIIKIVLNFLNWTEFSQLQNHSRIIYWYTGKFQQSVDDNTYLQVHNLQYKCYFYVVKILKPWLVNLSMLAHHPLKITLTSWKHFFVNKSIITKLKYTSFRLLG